jgi:hypothetical protein
MSGQLKARESVRHQSLRDRDRQRLAHTQKHLSNLNMKFKEATGVSKLKDIKT